MSFPVSLKLQIEGDADVQNKIKAINKEMQGLGKGAGQATRPMQQMSRQIDNVGKSTDKTGKTFKDYGREQQRVSKTTKEVDTGHRSMGQRIQGSAQGFALAGTAAISLWNAYDNVTDAATKVSIAETGVERSELRLSRAREALTKLQQSGTASSLDLAQAQQAVQVAEGQVERAAFNLTNAQEALNEAWLNAATSIVPALFTGISGVGQIMQSFGRTTVEAGEAAVEATSGMTELTGSAIEMGSAMTEMNANLVENTSALQELTATLTEGAADMGEFAGDATELSGAFVEVGSSALEGGANVAEFGVDLAEAGGSAVEFSADIAEFSGDMLELGGNAAETSGSMLEFGGAIGEAALASALLSKGAKPVTKNVDDMGKAITAAGAASFILTRVLAPLAISLGVVAGLALAVHKNFLGAGDGFEIVLGWLDDLSFALHDLGFEGASDAVASFTGQLDEGTHWLGEYIADLLGMGEESDEASKKQAQLEAELKTTNNQLSKLSPLVQQLAQAWGLYGLNVDNLSLGQQRQLDYLTQLESSLDPVRQQVIDLARAHGVDLTDALAMTDEQMIGFIATTETLTPTMEMAAEAAAKSAQQLADEWVSAFEKVQAAQEEFASSMTSAMSTMGQELGEEMEVGISDLEKKVSKGFAGFSQQFFDEIFPEDFLATAIIEGNDPDDIANELKDLMNDVVDEDLVTQEQAQSIIQPLIDTFQQDLPAGVSDGMAYLAGQLPSLLADLEPVFINGIVPVGQAAKNALDQHVMQPILQGLQNLPSGASGKAFGQGILGMIQSNLPTIAATAGPQVADLFRGLLDAKNMGLDQKVQEILAVLNQVAPGFADMILAIDQDSDGLADILDENVLSPVDTMKLGILEAFGVVYTALAEVDPKFRPVAESIQNAINNIKGPTEDLGATAVASFDKYTGAVEQAETPVISALKSIKENGFAVVARSADDTLVKVQSLSDSGVTAMVDLKTGIVTNSDGSITSLEELGSAADASLAKINALMHAAKQKDIAEDLAFEAREAARDRALGLTTGGAGAVPVPAVPDFTPHKQAAEQFKVDFQAILNTGWNFVPFGNQFNMLYNQYIGPALKHIVSDSMDWKSTYQQLFNAAMNFVPFGNQFNALFNQYIGPALQHIISQTQSWRPTYEGVLNAAMNFVPFGNQFNNLFNDYIGPGLDAAIAKTREKGGEILNALREALTGGGAAAVGGGGGGGKGKKRSLGGGGGPLADLAHNTIVRPWEDALNALQQLFNQPTATNFMQPMLTQIALTPEEMKKRGFDPSLSAGENFLNQLGSVFGAPNLGQIFHDWSATWQDESGAIKGPPGVGMEQLRQKLNELVPGLGDVFTQNQTAITGPVNTIFGPSGLIVNDSGGWIEPTAAKIQAGINKINAIMKTGFGGAMGPGMFTGLGGGNINPMDAFGGQGPGGGLKVGTPTPPAAAPAAPPPPDFSAHMTAWTNYSNFVSTTVNTIGQHLIRLVQGYALTAQQIQTAFTTMITHWTTHAANVSAQVNATGQHLIRMVQGYALMAQQIALGLQQAVEGWSGHAAAVSSSVNTTGQHLIRMVQGYEAMRNAINTALNNQIPSIWSAHSSNVSSAVNNTGQHLIRMVRGYELMRNAIAQALGQVVNAWRQHSAAVGTAVNQASTHVRRLASAVQSSMRSIVSSMNNAKTAANNLRNAINALRNRTITVTTRYRTVGRPARGGSTIAKGGGARGFEGVVNQPTRLFVGEANKPEFVQVIPLSKSGGQLGMNRAAATNLINPARSPMASPLIQSPTMRAGGSTGLLDKKAVNRWIDDRGYEINKFKKDDGVVQVEIAGGKHFSLITKDAASEFARQLGHTLISYESRKKGSNLNMRFRSGGGGGGLGGGFGSYMGPPPILGSGHFTGAEAMNAVRYITNAWNQNKAVRELTLHSSGTGMLFYQDGTFTPVRHSYPGGPLVRAIGDRRNVPWTPPLQKIDKSVIEQWIDPLGYEINEFVRSGVGNVLIELSGGKRFKKINEDAAKAFAAGRGYNLAGYVSARKGSRLGMLMAPIRGTEGTGGYLQKYIFPEKKEEFKAAYGFSGMVSKPTRFLAGENGKEWVNVQPLTGGGRGAKGGGRPVVIQLNIKSELDGRVISETVRKELLGGIYSMT